MPHSKRPHPGPPTPPTPPNPLSPPGRPPADPDAIGAEPTPIPTPTPTADTPQPSMLNPESLTIESGKRGTTVRLPTLVLAHLLSLAGVCGGTYQLAKPDVDLAKTEVIKVRDDLARLQAQHAAQSERLARIETTLEMIWEDVRDRRRSTSPRNRSTAGNDGGGSAANP